MGLCDRCGSECNRRVDAVDVLGAWGVLYRDGGVYTADGDTLFGREWTDPPLVIDATDDDEAVRAFRRLILARLGEVRKQTAERFGRDAARQTTHTTGGG